jgi:cytochrome c oxidase subunit 2
MTSRVLFAWLVAASLVVSAAARAGERVIRITAKRFEYDPAEIVLKRGEPVVLELTSLDRDHGFKSEELGLRADVKPGQVTRIRLVPEQVGRFPFACDVFCGDGHEDMTGEIDVVE